MSSCRTLRDFDNTSGAQQFACCYEGRHLPTCAETGERTGYTRARAFSHGDAGKDVVRVSDSTQYFTRTVSGGARFVAFPE